MSAFLGFDTSNYTTSASLYNAEQNFVRHERRLLDVPDGALGLRQSDAHFQHVKRLPDVLARLLGPEGERGVAAVGASTRPREAEGSYMPCFLAGESQARVTAAVLGVPFYAFSHQQGHLAAAAFSAGRPELLRCPFLGLHLSGGTTELLHVTPGEDGIPRAETIGGSSDLAAGQLIDRLGKRLSLPFPSGKQIDALAERAEKQSRMTPKADGLRFSLSGLENRVDDLLKQGESPETAAHFILASIAAGLSNALSAALAAYGALPVLVSGGVAANTLISRELKEKFQATFGAPEFSTDNAAGVAYLTYLRHSEN
ncbi:DNA-binding protein [Oscillospiraceae bacterium OttesenSCG-928-G22]|nr:DNA-binding protein [Oscillospiraceae bacterium OttesenSCG-928-G22]